MMEGVGNDFNSKLVAATASASDYRNELARRIRGVRKVSVANDPLRGYRKNANDCRRSGRYSRSFGIPKLPKPQAGTRLARLDPTPLL